MVASVAIFEWNGTFASRTDTNLTSSRYSLSDNAAPGTTTPLIRPSTGFNYSYWKHHALHFIPTFTTIDNIRWYTDGSLGWSLGTSGSLYIGRRASGDIGVPVSGYIQASGSSTTGVWMLSGHTYYQQGNAISGIWVLATTYTVGSPATIDSTSYGSSGQTKALVTQISIGSDATVGQSTGEGCTFMYDEI